MTKILDGKTCFLSGASGGLGQEIAKELAISQKKFLADYCELHVKLFPKSTKGILTFPTIFFPKRIGDLIKSSNILKYTSSS